MNAMAATPAKAEGVLEEVNKQKPAEGASASIFIAKARDRLSMVGWCYLSAKQAEPPAKTVTLLMIDYATQKQYRLVARRFNRRDVAAKHQNRALETCGFVCETLPNALRPGLYLVEAIQMDGKSEVRTVLGNGLLALL
jgi:hypothetical protein